MPSAAGEAAETGAQITNKRDGSGITDCQSPGPVPSSTGQPSSLEGGWSFVHAVLFIANMAFSFLCLERLSKIYFNRNELVLVKEGQCTACLFSAALGQPIFNTEKIRVVFAHC